MEYKISDLEDLDAITKLVTAQNNMEEHYIAYCCMQREHIYKDFQTMLCEEENRVVTAWKEGELYGVLGLFCINEIQRVDCVGPFVYCNEGGEDVFLEVAKNMLEVARKEYLNFSFSFNINSKNELCLKLMKMLGNVEANGEQELLLKRENFISKVEKRTVIAYTKEYEEQVKVLHDVIAKDYYLTSNELIKSNGDTIELYIILVKEEVVAYGALRFSELTDATVWIEIIGVKEQHRGKGYGKMMLDELLYQAFQRISVVAVKLNVDDINRTALSLYSSFGFECAIHTYSFMIL